MSIENNPSRDTNHVESQLSEGALVEHNETPEVLSSGRKKRITEMLGAAGYLAAGAAGGYAAGKFGHLDWIPGTDGDVSPTSGMMLGTMVGYGLESVRSRKKRNKK